MQQHTFYIERKATIWIRETHFVNAETEEQAKQIMIDNIKNEDTEETFDQQEFLYDTITDMDKADNLGYPVIELYDENMQPIDE